MNLLAENLFKNYTNRCAGESGVKSRMNQRLKWLNEYLKTGSCKNKLILSGILEVENDDKN